MSSNSTKNKAMVSALPAIVFIAYTVITWIMFLEDAEGVFWVSWVFSLVATVLTMAIPFWIAKKDKEVKTIIQGFSVATVTTLYFVAQLVLSFVFMLMTFLPTSVVAILEVLLVATYLVFIVLSVTGINVVNNIEKVQKEKVYFVKSIAVDLDLVANKLADDASKKLVAKLAESVKYSDPMSSPALAGLESQISIKVEELKVAADENDYEKVSTSATKIEQLFAERNEKCKLLK